MTRLPILDITCSVCAFCYKENTCTIFRNKGYKTPDGPLFEAYGIPVQCKDPCITPPYIEYDLFWALHFYNKISIRNPDFMIYWDDKYTKGNTK